MRLLYSQCTYKQTKAVRNVENILNVNVMLMNEAKLKGNHNNIWHKNTNIQLNLKKKQKRVITVRGTFQF